MSSLRDFVPPPTRRRSGSGLVLAAAAAITLSALVPAQGVAQPRLLPIGDSITHGGQGHASYRYRLWERLLQSGREFDYVGLQSTIFGGDPPNLAWYPAYAGYFDRDHEGHWGWRTDQIAAILPGVLSATSPDVVMIHLGTNDVGQSGAAGVANADANLRAIVGTIRAARPGIPILLAQVIPIGPGSSYFANATHVPALNSAIASIVADSNRVGEPLVLVDHFTGFNLGTMMQPDGLHPDTTGEGAMAETWRTALLPWLPAANPAPFVSITSPAPGASVAAGETLVVVAEAIDFNGAVARVRFLADSVEFAVDSAPPFTAPWVPQAGSHVLEAIAEDELNAARRSAPVAIEAEDDANAVVIPNFSFESPALADGALAPGPGTFGGWVFSGTPTTFLGIFDPPAGSYPEAAGSGTAIGAHGENAAYLFNNGGPLEQVEASVVLAETLATSSIYRLRVAVGRFLPDQPYASSSWGGYRIELRAGAEVVAAEENTVLPAVGRFEDVEVLVRTDSLPSALAGQPLSIRLTLGTNQAPRSTHFDRIRLTRGTLPLGIADGRVGIPASLRIQPNPARERARVLLSLPRTARIELDLFDITGRRVARLAARTFGEGSHAVEVPMPEIPGLYLLRMTDGEGSRIARLVRP